MTRCQQDRVYAAEDQLPTGRCFTNVTEVEAWVNRLRDEPWWTSDFASVDYVFVYPRRGTSSVGGYRTSDRSGQLELARNHLNERDVLHELAHVLAGARYGSQAHCPRYARTYAELVYRIMGSDSWLTLQRAYEAHDVDYGQRSVTT